MRLLSFFPFSVYFSVLPLERAYFFPLTCSCVLHSEVQKLSPSTAMRAFSCMLRSVSEHNETLQKTAWIFFLLPFWRQQYHPFSLLFFCKLLSRLIFPPHDSLTWKTRHRDQPLCKMSPEKKEQNIYCNLQKDIPTLKI